MKRSYYHPTIDKKWQTRWQNDHVFEVEDFASNPFYCLVEFPYPSGEGLHVGHPRSYTAMDIIARKKRMQGFHVLYPMGFDAFGLPAENFAIKKGIHPSITTRQNIERFRIQLRSMGFSFDWSREIITTDPSYYRWTQWIFLQFWHAGLAYKAMMPINWCPSCKIGLANEEVVRGHCERCETIVEKKNKEQWMLKITAYADRLLSDLRTVDYLPHIRKQQENWIGRSEGAIIRFSIAETGKDIEVFTTRPDTIFGATYLVLSPEHPLISKLLIPETKHDVIGYQKQSLAKTDFERTEGKGKKSGVFSGSFAIHPITEERIPVWIADYVLSSYGTGAIMGVPSHDPRDRDFAHAYSIPLKEVIKGEIGKNGIVEGEGMMINSEFLNGKTTERGRAEIIQWLITHKKGKRDIRYGLRDWVFSRQHYWGEPIPMIFCEHCGLAPVPAEQLPVELPYVEQYKPTKTGESPLAALTDWVKTTCPLCDGEAKRETDTMPTWAGSSWYFYRYLDPDNDKEFANFKKLSHWMPVDIYEGGMEHTTLHLLYSRFWNKFLCDRALVPTSEPYHRRHSHGLILGKGGEKMSKSRGNVINPDDDVKEYGADSFRMHLMFMGPFEEHVAWDDAGLIGMRRFLDRVYQKAQTLFHAERLSSIDPLLHKTIKKVSDDIEHFHLNTAISQLMIFFKELSRTGAVDQKTFEIFIKLLNPFAPHLTEEIWEMLGHDSLLCQETWPTFEEGKIASDEATIIVQVNGKFRGSFVIHKNAPQQEVEKTALKHKILQNKLPNPSMILRAIFVQDRLINFVVKTD